MAWSDLNRTPYYPHPHQRLRLSHRIGGERKLEGGEKTRNVAFCTRHGYSTHELAAGMVFYIKCTQYQACQTSGSHLLLKSN